MRCLQISITPLPQLVFVRHAFKKAGWRYTRRNFQLYLFIYCRKGSIHITEEGTAYSLEAGDMLLLDPDKEHWGHRKSEQDVEYYYVYFLHSSVIAYVDSAEIDWRAQIPRGNKRDTVPAQEQCMFLPKFMRTGDPTLLPLLNELVICHNALSLENGLTFQANLIELLKLLQTFIRSHGSSRSFQVSEGVRKYLQAHYKEEILAKDLEKHFHFHIDYLNRCFKQHTGMTPLQYVRYLRMNEVKHLLSYSDLSLKEIAHKVGIADYNYLMKRIQEKRMQKTFHRKEQGWRFFANEITYSSVFINSVPMPAFAPLIQPAASTRNPSAARPHPPGDDYSR